MINEVLWFAVILLCGEMIAALFYRFVLNPPFKIEQTKSTILEGFVERLFLFLSFVNGLYVALVFFGALKIATHINPNDNPPEQASDLPKNYYLMGNLISATFAVVYELLWRQLTGNQV